MLLEQILNLIAPHECVVCATEGHLLCDYCYRLLPAAPATQLAGLYRVWPGVAYQGAAKAVIHALKIERAAAAAADIAAHIAASLPHDTDWIITHAPTAPIRVRQRGYDQSARVARLLARRMGVVYTPLLARTVSVRQVGATRTTRQKQMRGAFRPIHSDAARGRHILLVDDVLTTGATVQAAAETLRAAGAARISAAVFASA